ncbi:MAG TPA: SMP-30/gluconolactonase/LRE family protein, partial [Gammaproteobacteria bacterium]|nr:SMP-30/gluconolactonase/LRE family protein [Gammaproteobacteria bacterium]
MASIPILALAGTQLLPGEREADVKAISGVVADGAEWQLVWADFVTADGIVGTSDGGLLFAQEQTDKIIKLDRDGNEYTYLADEHGPGAVSMDAKGRVYAVQRTCTEPLNRDLGGCNELTMVSMLTPEHRLLANSFPDGRTLGRPNDLIADGKGGVYFTSSSGMTSGAYYVNPEGVVSVVADQDIRSNGIMLSPHGRTLYVTNNDEVLAFDVHPDGSTTNRRVFGKLDG